MIITRFLAENIKKIKVVEITPDGAVVPIRGMNEAGKSSVLDTIGYVLSGKKSHPREVIRRGAEKARGVVEFGDLIVERTWDQDGGTALVVKSRDGKEHATPQKLLDELVGHIAFDPLSFMRKKPAQQVEILRELVGLDFSDLDKKHDLAFDLRHTVNRDAKAIKFNLAPADPDLPEKLLDVSELVKNLQAANEEIRKHDQHNSDVRQVADDIANTKARIADLEARLKGEKEALLDDAERLDKLREDEEWLGDKPDTAPIVTQLDEAEEHNRKYREAQEWREKYAKLQELETESGDLTEQLDALEVERKDRIAKAKFPIPGLAFSEHGLSFDGLPLEQAAESQRLRISVAMGIALNPGLRVILIREASLLDAEKLELVAKMAEEGDAQVWLEIVGDEGVGVIIEDGSVREVSDGT